MPAGSKVEVLGSIGRRRQTAAQVVLLVAADCVVKSVAIRQLLAEVWLLRRKASTRCKYVRRSLSYKFFCHIANPASCLHSLLPHLDRRLSPQGLDPLISFLKFTLARSATAPSYNMALITTSIKSNKSLLTFNVWLHYGRPM